MSDVEIIVKAIDLASPNVKLIGGSFDRLEQKVKQVGPGIKSAGDGVANFARGTQKALADAGKAWSDIATPINQTLEIFNKVWQAAQQAYQFISEGTQLTRTQQQFDALAGSIDTTSDALLSQLKTATRGTVSDFGLMEGASSLVSLGLTKTSDETVRLTKLIGQLGWDMNQVTLTLANQSTMRLDALGLSVEDVTGRVKDFEAQGYATDQAFKWAIIEAGEEKLNLLGDVAETTAGKLKILEANAQNFGNSFKQAFGENFIENLNAVSGGLFETEEGASSFGKTLGDIATNVSFLGFIRLVKDELADLGEESQNAEGRISGMGGVVQQLPPSLSNAAAGVKRFSDETKISRQSIIDATAATDGWIASTNTVIHLTAQAARERAAEATANYQASDAYGELQDKVYQTSQTYDMWAYGLRATNLELQNQANTIPPITGAVYASAEAVAAYNARMGEYYLTAYNAAGESLNVADAFTQSATAAGLNAEQIAGLQIAFGDLTPAQAEAMLKEALLRAEIDRLTEAVKNKNMTIYEARDAYVAFQNSLNDMSVAVNDSTGTVLLMNDSMVSAANSTQTLLDKFGMFPDQVGTVVNVDTTEAENRISSLEARLMGLGSGGQPGFASGGYQAPPDGTGSGGAPNGGGGYVAPGAATGANYIVPPGFNENWYQPVSSGEHVAVTPAGQIPQGNVTMNLYVTAMDGGANISREFNYMRAIMGA